MAINGTASSDNLNGTTGDDTILAAGGNDTVHGNGGNDLIDGGTGSDRIYGDDGADLLYGGEDGSADSLYGGAGDDVMAGEAGADLLDGGDGADAIGFDGGNQAYGGLGDDYLQANESKTGVFARTFVDGGEGFDLVDFTYYQYAHEVWLDQSAATGFEVRNAEVIMLGHAGGTAHGSDAADGIAGGFGADSIDGAGGDDVLSGGGGGLNTLNGGAGDDVFLFDGGEDLISGGAGVDTADFSLALGGVDVNVGRTGSQYASHGTVTLNSIEILIGSDGYDSLGGGAGDDTLMGGAEDDWLYVSRGADLLDGGEGVWDIVQAGSARITVDMTKSEVTLQDGSVNRFVNVEILSGGDGNDTFLASAANDYMQAGEGVDTLSYADAAASVRVHLGLGGQDTRGAGHDRLFEFEVLVGSDFNDVLTSGYNSSFKLRGGAGDDKLFVTQPTRTGEYAGGEGVDTLTFGDPGGEGGLIVDLTAGTAYVDYGFRDIMAFSGIERVIGTDQDDRFFASAADDIIDGGSAGFDTVSYENSAKAVTVSLSLGGGQKTSGSGIDKLIGIERLTGSAHDDVLSGAPQATVNGGAGDDLIIGVGNGTFNGGEGDDTFVSGKGNDWIVVSNGVNTMSYGSAGAAVTVTLKKQGSAQNTGGAGFDTLNYVQNLTGSKFGDTLVGDVAANVLAGRKGNDTLDGDQGADTIDGGAGRDRITGGLGADALHGGQDYDVFVYRERGDSSQAGADTIMDFKRGDLIDLSAVDAQASAGGNQAFHRVGQLSGAAGEAMLIYDSGTDMTRLLADTDGNGHAEFEIRILGELRPWDFVW